eukprot:TRINITY_DN668_c0_g1_i4.p1 TRINITY_DN668_c0_g1~~TRINITY_DN668_c0_g1_i4.p1  ORF type:complete len:475 (-),score=84.75 TRINITY_DN668_c0_g1_i4:1118-2542(-)
MDSETPSTTSSSSSNISSKKFKSSYEPTNDAHLNGKEPASVFDQKTEKASAAQYFHYYGQMMHQQNMLQDFVRTSTYQRAFLENPEDFSQKTVIDVGCGSGILSFFALQAGAKKVYAIEASKMAERAQILFDTNRISRDERLPSGEVVKSVVVINQKVEEVELPEKVDVIVSEPMGTLLLNERMIESYIYARKKWLKEGGKMFPSSGAIFVAPFTDYALYSEQASKASFWTQRFFYGVDLSQLKDVAYDEYFRQPIVDFVDPSNIIAPPVLHNINFLTCDESELQNVKIPLKYHMTTGGMLHGVVCWFDVLFDGSRNKIWLTTAPGSPPTHWYQIRCLLKKPIPVIAGQTLEGTFTMIANNRQSYEVVLEFGDEDKAQTDPTANYSYNVIDLKDPCYHFGVSTGVSQQQLQTWQNHGTAAFGPIGVQGGGGGQFHTPGMDNSFVNVDDESLRWVSSNSQFEIPASVDFEDGNKQ